jgi:hypothetical protein
VDLCPENPVHAAAQSAIAVATSAPQPLPISSIPALLESSPSAKPSCHRLEPTTALPRRRSCYPSASLSLTGSVLLQK